MGGATSLISSKSISLERRVNFLKKTPFFLYLQNDTLQEFARCFPNVIQKKGGTITLEKDKIYIVAEGELQLFTTIPVDNNNKVESRGYLCLKRPGDIFNKHDIERDAVRKLSTRYKKLERLVDDIQIDVKYPCKLLCSDKKALEGFLDNHQNLSSPIKSIISSQIHQYLATLPFLKGIKNSQIHVLAAMCRYEAFDKKQIVFEKNTTGSKLYIVVSGSASVIAPKWNGNASTFQQSLEWGIDENVASVADLKSGEYFGEIALFVNIPRTCTVITNEKSLFVTVEKTDFANFSRVCKIKESMTSVMKERMVSKLSSLGIPFFIGIPPVNLNLLANSVKIHQISDDEIIFRKGEVGDRFYIVIHGEVSVNTEENVARKSFNKSSGLEIDEAIGTNLNLIGAGSYFGEMALVNNSPRSATIISKGRSILMSVDQESFHQIFLSNPQALAEFKIRLLKASSELHHILDHSLGLSTFRSFLQQCVAEENLDFWFAAKSFEEMDGLVMDDLRIKAYEIYDQHCSESSPKEVNIPCGMRSKIRNRLEENEIDLNLFEHAKAEVYKLMVRDNYARFKLSPSFKEFFICLGILLD